MVSKVLTLLIVIRYSISAFSNSRRLECQSLVGGYQGQPDNVDQENWNKISHFISTDISLAAAARQLHNELEPYIYPLEFLNFDIDTVMKIQYLETL